MVTPASGPAACSRALPRMSPVAPCAFAAAVPIHMAPVSSAPTPRRCHRDRFGQKPATIILSEMAVLVPFAALRPIPSSAARVAAVPYDVVTTEEARALASVEPLSFLHVSRAEVDLPPGTGPYSDEVYAKAVTNLAALKRDAPLMQESPALYVYRLEIAGHSQTGIAGGFSIDEYEANLIRRH